MCDKRNRGRLWAVQELQAALASKGVPAGQAARRFTQGYARSLVTGWQLSR